MIVNMMSFIPLSIFNIDISSGNLILLVSFLMFVAILMAKVGTKFGVPTMLLFLILGMLAGEDGIGIRIDELRVAEFLGHLAMTIILLTGGLETSLDETRPIIKNTWCIPDHCYIGSFHLYGIGESDWRCR